MTEEKKDVERITAYRKMAAMGLRTINEVVCLLAINWNESIKIVELANVLGINRASASALAKRLEEKGFIGCTIGESSSRPHDRRLDSRHYHMTDAGRKAVEEGRKA